jgi:lactoylglutathione lyase
MMENIWLSVGGYSHLHLISGAEKQTVHDKFTQLCFTVPSMADFISRLDKGKVAYKDWADAKSSITTRVDGIKQIYFQDPDVTGLRSMTIINKLHS